MKNLLLSIACLLVLSACASAQRYLSAEGVLYRQLHTDSWTESAADPAVIADTLERIKMINSDTVSHVDLATRSYTAGNWNFEWDDAGYAATRAGNYLAAATYHTIAAYPFLANDKLSDSSYKLALQNYVKAVSSDGNYIEQMQIPTSLGTATAYLHLPTNKPDSPLPLAIVNNGSDHVLTQLYPFYTDYLKPRGWAMISLDLPGIGSNKHIGINTNQTNIIHQNLLELLTQESRIDATKTVLIGSSFGGHAVIKTAFTNPNQVAAAVSICGAVNEPFRKLRSAVKQVPRMTADAFFSRFNLSREEVIKTSKDLALSTSYLGKKITPVPILSINHDRDNAISPPSDMRLMARSSSQGEYIFVDKETEYGHCASDEKVLPIVMSWLEDKVL